MITVYGQPNCAGCNEAKRLLEDHHVKYVYHDITKSDGAMYGLMANFPGRKTVPAIGYIDWKSDNQFDFKVIGGLDELRAWFK